MRIDKNADNCNSPGPGQVALFENDFYAGDCVVLNHGQYLSATANPTSGQTGGGWGLRDNQISSVKISFPGPGHNFWLWNQPNEVNDDDSYYSGAAETPQLSVYGFDNKTSSLLVN